MIKNLFQQPGFRAKERKVQEILGRDPGDHVTTDELRAVRNHLKTVESAYNAARLRADRAELQYNRLHNAADHLIEDYNKLVEDYNALVRVLNELAKPFGQKMREAMTEAFCQTMARCQRTLLPSVHMLLLARTQVHTDQAS